MTFEQIVEVVENISCPPYEIVVHRHSQGASPILRVQALLPDAETGRPAPQTGRRWLLNHAMTESQVVQTAMLAVRTFVEHELRESFKYRGRSIFGPHLDISLLLAIADGGASPSAVVSQEEADSLVGVAGYIPDAIPTASLPLNAEAADYREAILKNQIKRGNCLATPQFPADAGTWARTPEQVPPGDANLIVGWDPAKGESIAVVLLRCVCGAVIAVDADVCGKCERNVAPAVAHHPI